MCKSITRVDLDLNSELTELTIEDIKFISQA